MSLETSFPCPPVALFGAVSLGGFTFHAPIIDLARSSWQVWLCFGICCSSGSGFICNESSDIDKKPQKVKGDRGWEYLLQADNQKLQGRNNAKVYRRNQEG